MSFALRIYNADGKKQLDTSSRVAKLITSFTVNVNSGVTNTYYVTGMTTDNTWFVIASDQFMQLNVISGGFTVKNNTIGNHTGIQLSVYKI